MKSFIKLICGAALLALTSSAFAQADTTYPGTQLGNQQFLGGTNNVTASAANSYSTASISVPKGGQFALSVQFKCDAASTSNIVLTLKPSDSAANVNVSTISSQWLTVTIPANGTNQVNWITNITVGAVPAYFITSITNSGSAGNVTNLQIRAVSKVNI